ncbi:MAG: hypothetical protein HQK49_15520 [Oligoflexia bacterium]|nr:hypothetical protein [Oligoflexia bacterium]
MKIELKKQKKIKRRQEKLAREKATSKDSKFHQVKKKERFNFGKVVVLTIAGVVLGVVIVLNLLK